MAFSDLRRAVLSDSVRASTYTSSILACLAGCASERTGLMAGSTANVKNWMHMSRWIVKLIRDEYGIDETRLIGTTTLDRDLGLAPAQIDHVLDIIAESFAIRFPDDGRDEIATLRELCTVACWLKGFYKRPDFISEYFERKCRAANPTLAA